MIEITKAVQRDLLANRQTDKKHAVHRVAHSAYDCEVHKKHQCLKNRPKGTHVVTKGWVDHMIIADGYPVTRANIDDLSPRYINNSSGIMIFSENSEVFCITPDYGYAVEVEFIKPQKEDTVCIDSVISTLENKSDSFKNNLNIIHCVVISGSVSINGNTVSVDEEVCINDNGIILTATSEDVRIFVFYVSDLKAI